MRRVEQERRIRDGRAYERFEALVELPLLFAAIALIPILGIPVIWEVSADVDALLTLLAWFIWALFVLEYLVLFSLAPSRWQMVRTHVFDLVIIALPLLRPLRAARSVRLLRLLSISGRIGVGLQAVTRRRGFRSFLLGVIVVILVGGFLTYAFERNHPGAQIQTVGDSLWWAIVTATTVGYGDFSPVSVEGRAIAVVLMLVGIGMLSVVTANVAAYFIESDEAVDVENLNERLDRIEHALAEIRASQSADSHGPQDGLDAAAFVAEADDA